MCSSLAAESWGPAWPAMRRCAAFAPCWSSRPISHRAPAAAPAACCTAACGISRRVALAWCTRRAAKSACLAALLPILAQPLAFIFPGRKGTCWPRWKLAVGAKLYDLLCGMRNFGRSNVLSRDETLRLLPGLSDRDLTGSVRYFDALTNDARLVLDTLRSAARHGAAAFNYVRLAQAHPDGNMWRCELAGCAIRKNPCRTGTNRRERRRTVVRQAAELQDVAAPDEGRAPGDRSRSACRFPMPS